MNDLPERVVAFYRRHARDLPWRRTRDPYAIWICEIMAQQTRLETMIPYWERWMARFPTVGELAAAPLDEVLASWAGLGYYSRARNLHAAAVAVVERHDGVMPRDPAALEALPGIGRYTVGAIGSIAFGHRLPVVDGNVKRILSRVYGVEPDDDLWRLADSLVPADAPGEFNQGLMDLGATLCTPKQPRCLLCPLAEPCIARREGRTAELPGTRRRAAVATVEIDVAWVVVGGRWLLARRAPKGLYGGLWELPAATALGLVTDGEPLVTHTQKLTHRTLVYRVHPVRLARAPRAAGAPYDAVTLVEPAALATLAVSSATAEIAAALVARGDPWPTPKKRSSSSPRVSPRSSRASSTSATTPTTKTSSTPRRAPRAGSVR